MPIAGAALFKRKVVCDGDVALFKDDAATIVGTVSPTVSYSAPWKVIDLDGPYDAIEVMFP